MKHDPRRAGVDGEGGPYCALCERDCQDQHTVLQLGQTIFYVACPDCAGDFRVAFANVLGSIRRERHHARSVKELG